MLADTSSMLHLDGLRAAFALVAMLSDHAEILGSGQQPNEIGRCGAAGPPLLGCKLERRFQLCISHTSWNESEVPTHLQPKQPEVYLSTSYTGG